MIKKSHQHEHLFDLSMKKALFDYEPDVLTMRTQNPVMYRAARKYTNVTYPTAKDGNDEKLGGDANFYAALAEVIGSRIARRLKMQNYSASEFFGKGTYGCQLNDSLPSIGDIEKLFTPGRFDNSRGDCIIIVGFVGVLGRTIYPIEITGGF